MKKTWRKIGVERRQGRTDTGANVQLLIQIKPNEITHELSKQKQKQLKNTNQGMIMLRSVQCPHKGENEQVEFY